MNKVILIGNVGKDPEARTTPQGDTVVNLSLATNHRWKDKQGNKQEKTEWHNLVMFGRTAELAQQYVTSGKQLAIEGRLETSSWDDKNTGQKKYKTEVIVDKMEFVGGSSSSDNTPQVAPAQAPAYAPPQQAAAPPQQQFPQQGQYPAPPAQGQGYGGGYPAVQGQGPNWG